MLFRSEGTHVATFSLAFKSTYKKEEANWIRAVCFNRNADTAEQYLHKGDRVGIVGLLDFDTWETDDGEKHSMHKIIVNNIEFLNLKNNKNAESESVPHLEGDEQPPF